MPLEYKPDFEEAADRWEAFWRGEVVDRPPVCIVAPRDGADPAPPPGQLAGIQFGYRRAIEMYEEYAASRVFMGEAMPYFRPKFGPDMYAAFLGAELKFSEDSGDTSWAVPFVDDWAEVLPVRFDPANKAWRDLMEFTRLAAEIGDGKFLISQADLHGNLDALLAMRGPERLCMDLIECPDMVEQALSGVVDAFPDIYNGIHEAGNMAKWGTGGWPPPYTRGRYCTLQCDFICMISPEMGRRFAVPALEREAECLDRILYHYDGPEALPHLDAICGIEAIDGIQWVPGAGNGSHVDWLDLLQDIQSRGKGLQLFGTPEEVKTLHRALRPEKVFYWVSDVKDQRQAEALLEWFRSNT